MHWLTLGERGYALNIWLFVLQIFSVNFSFLIYSGKRMDFWKKWDHFHIAFRVLFMVCLVKCSSYRETYLITWYCCVGMIHQKSTGYNEKQKISMDHSMYFQSLNIFTFKHSYCYLNLFELVVVSTCYHIYTRTINDKLSINDFLITFFWTIPKTTMSCILKEANFCSCHGASGSSLNTLKDKTFWFPVSFYYFWNWAVLSRIKGDDTHSRKHLYLKEDVEH